MRVLDSIHENGAKLVEMPLESVSDLRANQPGIRVVPIVHYYPQIAMPPIPQSAPQMMRSTSRSITIKVVSQENGEPVAGATVIAITDFDNRIGAQGTTSRKGEVRLSLVSTKVERLYVYPKKNFWSILKTDVTMRSGQSFDLIPIQLEYRDALRFFYPHSSDNLGQDVKVGIIDTGIAEHPDLKIDGGVNTVPGEAPSAFGDNGEGHGTHVAGIVAARGTPPRGIRGIAPGVILRSYRVFAKNSSRASNYAIAKAIDRAVADGCDLLNLSLGGGPSDPAVRAAIADARARGTLVIAAAGNEDRSPVSFPASDSLCLAVSALGRQGTFPPDSSQIAEIGSPYGEDKKNFIARFSNFGSEIDLTGPGVGIISTVPGGYAAWDGTSMACPAVTGAAAGLMSDHPGILNSKRDQNRSDSMARAVLQAAKSLGFSAVYQGQGLL
jgi:subtilisin